MISNKQQTVKVPFVLDADSLRRLDGLLTEETDTERIEYKVSLTDGTTMAPDSLDDVLALPNGPKRAIRSIDVSTTRDAVPRASVTFRNESELPITYDLSGEDNTIVALSEKLKEYFMGLRQWCAFAMSDRMLSSILQGAL